jgi:iron complex outermembrane receptor protein
LSLSRAGALLLAMSGGTALAQGSPPPPPPQRVVVEGRTADEADTRRLATMAMTVVGRDELDAYGDSSILDVLQRLPGITLDGETPRLRGLGPGYTQILINGEPAPPGFSLDTLAPADIERIEIVKGPTAEYGGVAGVINVVLRVPPRLAVREWRQTLGYRAVAPQGSVSLAWGDRIGGLDFHLPVGLYTWANGATTEVQRTSRLPGGEIRQDRQDAEDEWRGRGFNLAPRLEWKADERHTLSWQGFAQGSESDNRSRRRYTLLDGPPLARSGERSASAGLWQLLRTQLQWVRKAADGSRLELKASAQGSRTRSAATTAAQDGAGAAVPLRDTLASQREQGFSQGGRWRQPLAESHTLTLGWDFEHRDRRELRRAFDDGLERVTTNQGPPFFARVNRSVVFVQDEWAAAPRWTVLAGLRGEALDIRTAGPAAAVDNEGRWWSPSVQLRHALDDKGRQLLRLNLSRSLKVPDVSTLLPRYALNGTYDRDTPNTPLAPDSAGNPLLRPERAAGIDLAWERHFDGGGVASVGGFHRRIEDLVRRRIALETVAEASLPRWVSRPSNVGRARSSGIELELKAPGPTVLPGFFAAGSGVLLRGSVSVYRSQVEQIDDPDARLDGQPPWGATLGFDRATKGRDGSAFGWGASLALSPAFSTQQTDRQRVWRSHQRRLDAYLSWRLDRQLQLRVAGNNLLGADALSASRLVDVDGFAAASQTRRTTPRQFNATVTMRY